jgi:hypothetical protein
MEIPRIGWPKKYVLARFRPGSSNWESGSWEKLIG